MARRKRFLFLYNAGKLPHEDMQLSAGTTFLTGIMNRHLDFHKISRARYAKDVGVSRYTILALTSKTANIEDIPCCDLVKICDYHNMDLELVFHVRKK